jgi:hypothetical protein
MAIIMCLFGMSVTTPYNCEVRVFSICFICTLALTCCDTKLENLFQMVSSPSDAPNL